MLEEALRAGVEGVVYTSSVAAIGPAPPGSTADERQVFDTGRHGLPYVDSKHEAEVEALRFVARGLPLVIVNPAHVIGPGDRGRSSTTLVRRYMRREIPAYVNGTLNIVGVEDVARGHLLADEVGKVGERYILGNRNFTLDRLFADLARLSGVEPPAGEAAAAGRAGPGADGRRRAGRPGALGDRDPRRIAELGVSQHQGQARAGLDAPRRTRTASRRRSPGTGNARARVCRRRARGSRWRCGSPPARCAAPGCSAGLSSESDGDAVPLQYADQLAVSVRQGGACARRDGIPFQEAVVPQRRSRRPEVEALTGQRRVPVLVIDGEAICDSRRIVEHLEFRRDAAAASEPVASSRPDP